MAEQHSVEGAGTSIAAPKGSESTIEIHIKTLDSRLYTFRVDKNMPVLAFKETIASDVGLPVGQQRLIFRGKVLRDEHQLSEYHIDDGHTLHLVARQPPESQPSSGSSTGTTPANGSNTGGVSVNANAAGSRPRVGVSHSVVLGTFGVGDQTEGGTPPDISRVIGAVLNSFGIGGQTTMSGIGGSQPNMQFNIPVQVAQGNEPGLDVSNQGQPGNPSQPAPQGFQVPLGAGMAIPTLATPIPDSLHTLSEFMNRMEQALSHNGYRPSQVNIQDLPAVELPSGARGMRTPAALAVVLRHAHQLLSGPVIDSLSHAAGRLEEEESCTDLEVRTQIQSEAMQIGFAMQHLGTLLLELGRAMLTLHIARSPAESSVNAGPAVYISSSGPNPIMVQPSLQTSLTFGSHGAPINSMTSIGAIPRHINVHIHAGPRGNNVEPNQGEHANQTADAGINLQTSIRSENQVDDSTRSENVVDDSTRSESQVDENTRSENQASAGQPMERNTTSSNEHDTSSSAMKSSNYVEGASSSSPAVDNSGNTSSVPLGLGLGGLQPKRRSRQIKPASSSSSVPSSAPASSANSPAGGEVDAATMMNQVIANPALDGLLSGISNQSGVGSPDMLRNMLGQLTQNPAMMNTISQIAQQIDGNQDVNNMFAGMGGGSGGGGGGFDLSSMVQQMMPIVAQAFGGGGGGSSSNMFQQLPSMDRELQPKSIDDSSSDPQVNLQELAERIEQQQESPEEVFASVVDAAAQLNGNGDELSDLSSEEGLAHEFMELLKRDISLRSQEEEEE